MVEVVALSVTVVLAVAGFVVNAQAARRAKRRDIRTQYLLDAYRSIEAASNRPMDSGAARDLEAALADVQPLGTTSQVDPAHRFANDFASNGGADTSPILNELRDELRADLDLGPLPERRTHLRITLGSEQADIEWSDNARISAEAIAAQQRAATPATTPSLGSSEAQQDAPALLNAASAAWEGLLSALADSLEAIGVSVANLGPDDQLNVASERGLISEKTLKGIAGLNVMWSLLSHDARDGRLTSKRSRSSSCWPQPSGACSTPASQDLSSSR
jgi:hypothetical protein